MKTSSMIIIGVATVLGLFFGYATDLGLLGAIVFGALAAGGAYLSVARDQHTADTITTTATQVADPPLARFLFQDTRAAALWLPIRLFVGWDWLTAGWHKFQDPKWLDTGVALQGYWKNAVAVPAPPARAAITYDWWRAFLQFLLDNEAYTWFGKVITFGEMAVGLGLIFGALVGVAAAGGILMNMSFMLSGSTSSNPILLILAFAIILAWKVAGWLGLDRFLLPMLGTPWQRGALLSHGAAPPPNAPPARVGR
jgi:thiosulfate dehydrogenase [quinone] large subunit